MTATPSRRLLLQAGAACLLAAEPATAATTGLVEPHMRLKARSNGDPRVALTLDACPGAFDTRIAEALAKMDVPATIFITGAWIRRNPDGAAFFRDNSSLFALENHGDHHIPPVLGARKVFGIQSAGDLDAIHREILDGAEEVKALTGDQPLWYRGATGFYSPSVPDTIESWGFGVGGYSLNADMGASLPARTVASRIGAARDGDVIVAHVNQPKRSSGAGVVAGVMALRDRGVRFVRLDHLERADVTYEKGSR